MKSATRILLLAAAISAFLAPAARALTAETWLGLPQNPSVITLQREGIAKRAPDSTASIASASLSNLAAGTGIRLRGSVTPTVAGNYTFAVSGSRNVALWLSTDGSGSSKQLIAWSYEPTNPLQWTKFASQQSATVALAANTSYYIEAQVMSSTAAGHLALGWKTPGSSTIETIPIGNLTPLAQDPADLNGNNLPDAWETQTGLAASAIPGALSEYGDPDNDGITNFQEYLYSSDPLALDTVANGITRDNWSELQGQGVSRLTGARTRFLSYPSSSSHVPVIDETSPGKIEGKNYGACYHGFLIAPATGTYRLWIAGDDDAELWFADGSVVDPDTSAPLTNRFGKQLLAHTHNPGGQYGTPYRDFDLIPSQRSRTVQLTAGQTYFIEVLHKNESLALNHVTLAWETPGQIRTIVPASAYHSDVPEETDADNDALPDAWETTVGLSITDNGFTSAKQGQYGDFDSDGLSNLLEFQIGTNPKLADTDGDGITDSDEINRYHTNPLVPNIIATTLQSTLNLSTPANTSFPWKTNTDGTISAYERRGWIDWTFTVAPGQEGVHEIRLIGGATGPQFEVPLSFRINGHLIGRQGMLCKPNQNTTVKQLTPFLPAGTHTLRAQSHNVRADIRLRINSITINRLGGTDANSNGIADWAEEKFGNENRLTTLPSESLTSPAYVEGVTSNPTALSIQGSTGGSGAAITPQLATDDIFFAEIPLSATDPNQLTVSFLSGASPQTQVITWAATNILGQSPITIRKGDSLRVTAYDPSGSPTGTFTLGGSAGAPSTPPEAQNSTEPIALTFDNPGTHTFTATWSPPDGAPQTGTLTVHVATADFGSTFVLQTYNRLPWTVPGVQGMDIEADSALFWRETTASGATSRSFLVNAYNADNFRVAARIPATGRIIAVGDVSAFSLARAGATADAQTVETRPDGSKVIRFTIVAENLPSNAEIRIHMNYQGTIFPNGSRDLTLRPSDFSSNGIANVLVETSSDPPQLCHSMRAYLID
jgi:hypothetical protein